jgi:hypothetical protein
LALQQPNASHHRTGKPCPFVQRTVVEVRWNTDVVPAALRMDLYRRGRGAGR